MAISEFLTSPFFLVFWLSLVIFIAKFAKSDKIDTYGVFLIYFINILAFFACIAMSFPNFVNSQMQSHFLNSANNSGMGLYHELGSEYLYSGFYGPMSYVVPAFLLKFGASIRFIKFSFLVIFIATAALVTKIRTKESCNISLAAISILLINYDLLRVGPGAIIFLFAVLLVVITKLMETRPFVSSGMLGMVSALLCLIKPHLLVLGVFPVFFYGNRIISRAIMFGVCFVVSILIFVLLFDFNVKLYVELMSVPLRHSIEWSRFFLYLLYVAIFIPIVLRVSSILATISFAGCGLILSYASSKVGSDLSHLYPLFVMVICLISMNRNNVVLTKFQMRSLIFVVPFSLLPFMLKSYGSSVKWYLMTPIEAVEEMYQIRREFLCLNDNLYKSCVSMGYGSNPQNYFMSANLSSVLLTDENRNLIDSAVIIDRVEASNQNPEGLNVQLIKDKKIKYFVIPAEEQPFSLPLNIWSKDDGNRLFPKSFKEQFEKNYVLIKRFKYFDLFQAKL